MKEMPKWAADLMGEAIAYRVTQGRTVQVPKVVWRRARRKSSSGAAYPTKGVVHISVGSDRLDAKVTLLHELAHIWAPPPGWTHSPAFWDLAWELYRWAKLPIQYVKQREGSYRKGALVAYHKSMKKEEEGA